MPALPRYNVFTHLNADKAPLYRAILGIFAQAKARFVIHLRPSDLESQLAVRPEWHQDASPVESALQQLVEWGNLESHADTAEVSTVQDFWRVRSLYQMSPAGEAVEAAMAVFEQSIQRPGELQAAALDDIRKQLRQIVRLTQDASIDNDEVFNTFSLLRQRFDELTTQAQRFISGLQRRTDLESLDVELFLAYKRRLIDYLERFLSQLVLATYEIASMVRPIDLGAMLPLLRRVAERELIDRLTVTEHDRAEALENWQQRWSGLCSWFVGDGAHASQAEELRNTARSAIRSLVAAVTGINDRRAGRSDRASDLRALALWFAQAEHDEDAHRIWRAAFALHSSRHLSIDQESIDHRANEPVLSTTSWLDAPPLTISPRLHSCGRYSARGSAAKVIDRSAERAYLARLAAEESAEIHQARSILATGARVRLSKLDELPNAAFQLFLDVLGDALAAAPGADGTISTTSSDGTLQIELSPTRDGQIAVIRTSSGVLLGEDHYIRIVSNVPEESETARLPEAAQFVAP